MSVVEYLFVLLDKLNLWIDEIEYHFGNFIDPPSIPVNKANDTEKWLEKITSRQALRYAKYMYRKSRGVRVLAENADLSQYKSKKDRKTVEKFCEALIYFADYLEDLYWRMYKRKLSERSKQSDIN